MIKRQDNLRINFLASNKKSYLLYAKSLEINNDFKDSWVKFEKDSVASFKQCFFRINKHQQKEGYFVLDNVFLAYFDDEITIEFNNTELVLFERSKLDKQYEQQLSHAYRKSLKELNYFKALKNWDIDITDQLKLDEVFWLNFYLKALYNFSLVKKQVLKMQ